MSQFQYRNENQNSISNFVFQFVRKMKWHFGYTDLPGIQIYQRKKNLKFKLLKKQVHAFFFAISDKLKHISYEKFEFLNWLPVIKGAVMQIEKALINDRLFISKVS